MKRLLLFAFPLVLFYSSHAGNEGVIVGGRQAAMGLASVTSTDFWSVHNNQAGLAFFDRTSAGLYMENRFILKELGYQSAGFALKTQYGMLGATIDYSGDANYNTTKAGIAYSRKLSNRIAVGIQLDYIGTSLGENYGKHSNVTFDVGILVLLNEKLTFGAHTFNPLQVKLSDYDNERIPTTMNAGLSYTFSEKLFLTAEAFKQSNHDMEFRTGVEYKFNNFAFARAGITTNPFRYTFGFGIELKQFTIDFASSVHQQLGYSPQISLQYIFGR